MPSLKYERGAIVTVLDTQLNSLADAARSVASAAQDNTLAAQLMFWADFELFVDLALAPTENKVVELYLLTEIDGTNYADGSDTVQPRYTSAAGSFPMDAVATAQRVVLRGVPLPPTKWKALVKNSSGQAFAATLNTLKYLPYREQSV